jgi:ornithine carbamoyltransferase
MSRMPPSWSGPRSWEPASVTTTTRWKRPAARRCLNTDVWASMGQEAEQARRMEAFAGFQINDAIIAAADAECIILHCLPAHRGEEITDEAIESHHSVVFDEAENRLHVQKAIMATLMARE